MKRVAWIVDSSPNGIYKWPWQRLSVVAQIRYKLIAKYLERQNAFAMEYYRPHRRYDAVVFVKMMNKRCLQLAQSLRQKGVKILFDANVNYYETWGDYVIPGTQPTTQQHEEASKITSLADHVIADSSYLAKVCKRLNPRVTWIPDAVDMTHFPSTPKHIKGVNQKLRLIWSGISKKAHHLELIEHVLKQLSDRITLTLVTDKETPSNTRPAVFERLRKTLKTSVHYYSPRRFYRLLQCHDLIISPKILNNAYEVSHTEYKITLGMAAGLPAIASPQPSYVDAIGDGIGGRICETAASWEKELVYFLEHPAELLAEGQRARERVLGRYSVAVVAQQYRTVLEQALCDR